MQQAAAPHGIATVAVGFSPPDALAPIADHLGWDGPFLADPDRLLYRRLGLDRAPWWRVWSPGTIAFYVRARRRGAALERPVEDTRQLGGDAVVVDGTAQVVWRPRSPDDRPAATELVAAVPRPS